MTRLTAGLVLLLLAAPDRPVQQQVGSSAVPVGFAKLSEAFWEGPWVLDGRGAARPALHHARDTAPATIDVRLDDGTSGTLRVESRPCAEGDECGPSDCGCPLDDESFWIEVADASERRVARVHLWAAYQNFDIVPVDLVGGPGDELVVIRNPAHAAPPIGRDLKIWRIAPGPPVELIAPMAVAGTFDSLPFACARWRTTLSVDLQSVKPRPLTLRAAFAAGPEGCRLDGDSGARHAALAQERTLRFEREQYRIR